MEEQPRTWQEIYDALRKCGMNHATAYQRADDHINQRLRWEAQTEEQEEVEDHWLIPCAMMCMRYLWKATQLDIKE